MPPAVSCASCRSRSPPSPDGSGATYGQLAIDHLDNIKASWMRRSPLIGATVTMVGSGLLRGCWAAILRPPL